MPHFWAHRREDNAIAIRLLDEALATDPRLGPGARPEGAGASARRSPISGPTMSTATSAWRWRWPRRRPSTSRSRRRRLCDDRRHPFDPECRPVARPRLHRAGALPRPDLRLGLDRGSASSRLIRASRARALASLRRAIRLSPDDPVRFNAYAGMATCLFMLGDYAEAAKQARLAIDARPGHDLGQPAARDIGGARRRPRHRFARRSRSRSATAPA